MPKRSYKHKTLLDEHLYHRRVYSLLNERFDVKHIRDDLHVDGLPDPQVYELAVKQERILLTTNVKDFRPLLQVCTLAGVSHLLYMVFRPSSTACLPGNAGQVMMLNPMPRTPLPVTNACLAVV
jgi:Domain of unknown function (DUF5615)